MSSERIHTENIGKKGLSMHYVVYFQMVVQYTLISGTLEEGGGGVPGGLGFAWYNS